MNGPIERQTIWDNAAQLVSEEGENPEYDRGVVELVADLFGYTSDEKTALLDALRMRRQQQRELWHANLPVDPTTGGRR